MEATRLYNHTGDIIHAFVHGGHRIRIRTDAATSPSIAMYGVSTDCATETSPKKEAQISHKDYHHHSTLGIGVHIYIFFFSFL